MSNCNCGHKDQTPKESLDKIKTSDNPQEALGTGMFMVPAPELGIMEYRVIVVEKPMTYIEASKRGSTCIAYKWISLNFKSLQDIQTRPPTNCFSQFCINGNCESWDCWCSPNSNYCR